MGGKEEVITVDAIVTQLADVFTTSKEKKKQVAFERYQTYFIQLCSQNLDEPLKTDLVNYHLAADHELYLKNMPKTGAEPRTITDMRQILLEQAEILFAKSELVFEENEIGTIRGFVLSRIEYCKDLLGKYLFENEKKSDDIVASHGQEADSAENPQENVLDIFDGGAAGSSAASSSGTDVNTFMSSEEHNGDNAGTLQNEQMIQTLNQIRTICDEYLQHLAQKKYFFLARMDREGTDVRQLFFESIQSIIQRTDNAQKTIDEIIDEIDEKLKTIPEALSQARGGRFAAVITAIKNLIKNVWASDKGRTIQTQEGTNPPKTRAESSVQAMKAVLQTSRERRAQVENNPPNEGDAPSPAGGQNQH